MNGYPAIDLKDKLKMEDTIVKGSVLHNCATIVFIVGDRRIALSEDRAQYALYNMILYAQSIDIGTCLWGGAKIFLNRDRAARKLLSLKKHEYILGAVRMGYPAVSFRNKVEGKIFPIQWITERADEMA